MIEEETKVKIVYDLTKHIRLDRRFYIWMGFLTVCLVFCLYAYSNQLNIGLGVTGMRDYISWGIYVSNFVFFVATSLIGMLISSVLGLIGQKWIIPISRIAEIIAFTFASVAGLVIITDMGRPERLMYIFIYGQFQSPVVWDLTLVILYFLITMGLYFVPAIPDIAILNNENKNFPRWQKKLYQKLSFNWNGTRTQKSLLMKTTKLLLLLAIPVAFGIHTVTSWLFALTPRPGWNSTIFGPYFIAGAFVTGVSALIIVTVILRKIFRLEEYITQLHFDKLARLLLLVSLIYLYFNVNEYLVSSYNVKKGEAVLLHELFSGRYSVLYWLVQIAGVLLPAILPLFKFFRKNTSILILSILVLVASWFKRYLIIIPTMENPLLPIQNVPGNFIYYKPTEVEIAVTAGTIVIVIMFISILAKIFPVIPVNQILEEMKSETLVK